MMRALFLSLLVLTALPSRASALQSQTLTFRPVADSKVWDQTPTTNYGTDTTLRVRSESGNSYRTYLRFDLSSLGGASVQSAKLRLYCTDESPDGGRLRFVPDNRWSETGLTWSNQPSFATAPLAALGAVALNAWYELDATSIVQDSGELTGGVFTFVLGNGTSGSTNSALFSSREGTNPPQLVVTVAGSGGGGNPPAAEFTGSPLTGAAPLQVTFGDRSTGQVTTWLWNFGDGATSTQQNPVHMYSAAGSYSVTLTATGPAGTSTLTKNAMVHPFSATAHGIWTSAGELALLPTSGTAWNSLLAEANRATGTPDIINQDDDTDVRVLAKALVFARTGNQSYRTQVIDACMRAIGTERGGRTLALARNVIGYVLAADLVGLPSDKDATFRAWLRTLLRTEQFTGGPTTLVATHEERPNNWGTHAGASRAAIAVYLDDQAELARCAQVFRGWLGDRSSYSGFQYGDVSWQADSSRPVGINPRGATKGGHSIDGVLPDDQRRAGGFLWPPPKENYVWEALQGAVAQAMILSRAGYDAWEWSDQALLRATDWLHGECNFPASGDDTWIPYALNYFYAADFPAPVPSNPGKNLGWTDWTLQ